MRCWWIFFHDWDRWEAAIGMGSQYRDCKKCGRGSWRWFL